MPIHWIIILLITLLAAIVLVISYVFSGIVIHSRRQPIARTPQEYRR